MASGWPQPLQGPMRLFSPEAPGEKTHLAAPGILSAKASHCRRRSAVELALRSAIASAFTLVPLAASARREKLSNARKKRPPATVDGTEEGLTESQRAASPAEELSASETNLPPLPGPCFSG